MKDPIYPNKDDYDAKFWNFNYKILVTSQGIVFIVNADSAGDAIDYVIDYCQEHLPGLLFTPEEALNEEFIEDYICGGNEGLYFNTSSVEIYRKELDEKI
jgi:hypothetical protein